MQQVSRPFDQAASTAQPLGQESAPRGKTSDGWCPDNARRCNTKRGFGNASFDDR
jgi:hypothetical protein